MPAATGEARHLPVERGSRPLLQQSPPACRDQDRERRQPRQSLDVRGDVQVTDSMTTTDSLTPVEYRRPFDSDTPAALPTRVATPILTFTTTSDPHVSGGWFMLPPPDRD
jgi:hypothetical protein